MDEFMLRYFKQSFLRASGIYDYIKKPTVFKKNIKSGAKLANQKVLTLALNGLPMQRLV
jgi:hypothetical protein